MAGGTQAGGEVGLGADEARRLQLRAQGFLGARPKGGVPAMLERLGAVQLDTISVLARSHELVPYARLGTVSRSAIEAAYWGASGRGSGGNGSGRAPRGGYGAFEYWAHAASVIPMADWPLFAFRRRAYLRRGWRWHKVPEGVCDEIRARLKADGPLTTKELGGAKASAEWWDWSDHKIGIEWLLDIGEVVCVERVGWRRVYDLAERAVPSELLAQDLDDDACLTALVARAGRALGVATRGDLADYYRIKQDQVDRVIEATGLVPAAVAGWSQRAWADPDALAAPPKGRHATTLLSPFDSLVWDRARASRVFGFDHRLEAYVPKGKRVHGYFAMPLLAGGRLIGRVDPAREGRTLIARQASLEPWATRTAARTETSAAALATALWRAAAWVGCDDVRVERTALPPTLVKAALATATPH
ncbi:winged helix-turn-helix domain-containing protein [Actinomadura sp. NAK00032]|uniref:winged helix-turn-helix domain-containing protein n=1 Tax=Actinomadura sp. NAK00032 TaxID=2742128 RepID=UPI0015905E7E|nr:crosslink repair DNA glycosylase YcaQ family protein [Actinomadura sp. NAK00032]QKW40913.1 winged helix-turn-helix domain-containing protein [Actinomadura sp. NAK00032]